MRRAFAIVLLGGAALLFAFRFQPPPTGTIEGEGEIVVEPIEPAATTTTISPLATTPWVPGTVPTTTTLPLGPGVQVVAGPMVYTGRGYVQVEIKVFDGIVADINMIKVPSESQRAKAISLAAGRKLRVEGLEMQTYRLHNVSGATETSRGYIHSLKYALIDAGILLARE
jgi:hypothetical protein